MKRRLLLLALLFADAAAGQTELVVWHSYRAAEKAAIEKVAAAFNASHPGTRVTTLAVPYDAFADKISAAVPRGKGPDIFIYAQDRLGGWIEAAIPSSRSTSSSTNPPARASSPARWRR